MPRSRRIWRGIPPSASATNTNWQSYSGESTMSEFSQMVGLTIHNFTSAATGIALAFAIIRGFARKETSGLGNFWADVTRITLYILLPACLIYALILLAAGVPQTFNGSVIASTLEGAKQTIVLGPVASQEAIKMVGTNGGGIFNGNSATSVRKSQRAGQLPADAVDLLDRRGADLVLRQGGRQHPAGLGDLQRHADPVPGGHDGDLCRRIRR